MRAWGELCDLFRDEGEREVTYSIHPKSAAKVRALLGLADDDPITVADLYRAAEIEYRAATPNPESEAR
jgi:hypothetical protein